MGEAQDPRVGASQGFYCSGFINKTNKQTNLLACQQKLTSTEYSSCQHEVLTRESWIRVGYRYYRPTCDPIISSIATPRPCPLSQASCWSGDIIPPLLRNVINKGTVPDHDGWLARPPPPTTRKRGISMISAPVLVLELSIAPAVLNTYVDPRPSLSTLRLDALTHNAPATVRCVTLPAPDLGPQQQSAKSIGKH